MSNTDKINNQSDTKELQKDLDELTYWEKYRQLHFSPDNVFVKIEHCKQNVKQFCYTLSRKFNTMGRAYIFHKAVHIPVSLHVIHLNQLTERLSRHLNNKTFNTIHINIREQFSEEYFEINLFLLYIFIISDNIICYDLGRVNIAVHWISYHFLWPVIPRTVYDV